MYIGHRLKVIRGKKENPKYNNQNPERRHKEQEKPIPKQDKVVQERKSPSDQIIRAGNVQEKNPKNKRQVDSFHKLTALVSCNLSSPVLFTMKKELIAELFSQFENACYEYKGIECWSARELQEVFAYTKWDNFLNVIEKAKKACEQAGENITDHFAAIGKMVVLGSGAERELEDIALTRYACYLVAQNGDPSKQSIAFAQTYFAVQTRKQEIIEQRLLDIARVSAREKLSKS